MMCRCCDRLRDNRGWIMRTSILCGFKRHVDRCERCQRMYSAPWFESTGLGRRSQCCCGNKARQGLKLSCQGQDEHIRLKQDNQQLATCTSVWWIVPTSWVSLLTL